MNAVAYKVVNQIDGKSYIGVTQRGMATREKQHRYDARRGAGHLLHAAMRKHGGENFVFEQLGDFGDDFDLALIFEQEAIAKWEPEYNLSEGGEGRTGPMTEEHKKALSRANKGQGLGRKGPPMSEETKQRLREVNKGNQHMLGHKHTEETKKKVGEAHRGRVHLSRRGVPRSPETIAKMSASQKGRASIWKGAKRDYGAKVSAALAGKKLDMTEARRSALAVSVAKASTANKRPVVCLTDGRVFASSVEAAEFYGARKAAVSQAIRRGYALRSGHRFSWVAK